MSMIYQDTSSFGKQIPIYVRYRVLEDATKEVDTTKTFFAGLPVTISSIATGQKLVPVTTDVKVYGLAKFQKNQFLDEVTGTSPSGIYGSYRGTVVVQGIVDVVAVMNFTGSSGTVYPVTIVDTAIGTLNPMTALYVDETADGTYGHHPISTDSTNMTNTLVGYVMNYDSVAGIVQILLP